MTALVPHVFHPLGRTKGMDIVGVAYQKIIDYFCTSIF
jgi:hypothetical protein